MRPALAALALVPGLSGCGSYDFYSGMMAESRGSFPKAIMAYERFAESHPGDPRAAEAHVRAGRIYASVFERCLEARRHFESAARGFPKLEPWAAKARAGVMSCPDYFPLEAGRGWVYGDSDSKGRAMRLEWEVRAQDGKPLVLASLYAGARKLKTDERRYETRDWMVWERQGESVYPILRYPFVEGQSWDATRDKKTYRYRIESSDAAVKTEAGDFKGCLKVRETDPSVKAAWKFDYYCPSVGRALTTVAGKGFENPNTELLKIIR